MSETARYSRPQIALHSLMTLLILALYAVGLSVDFFEKPLRPTIINLHALGGLLVLVLLVPRLLLRFVTTSPAYPAKMGPRFIAIAKAGHAAIYALMVVVPALGITTFLLRGAPLNLYFTQYPAPFPANPDLAEQFQQVHLYAAHALIALVAGHALVALFHHFVLRDGLLERMKAAAK
jgi:cytochrome b561